MLFPHIHPAQILGEPVLAAAYQGPGYSRHAADVWRAQTASRTVALRVFDSAHWGGPFWSGLRYLFRWSGTFRAKVAARNRFLMAAGGLATPRVFRHGEHQGLDYLVMEWMDGQRCASFRELSPDGLEAYGRHLARMHAQVFQKSGVVQGNKAWPAPYFQTMIGTTMQMLAGNFYQGQAQVASLAEEMAARAQRLPVEHFVPVMADLSADQYLRDAAGGLCALVVTDACVLGPREMDFVLLEYGLDRETVRPFLRGYQALLPLPRLSEARPIYRCLFRLMEVEGAVPFNIWMDRENLFPG